jgi:copper transport protein
MGPEAVPVRRRRGTRRRPLLTLALVALWLAGTATGAGAHALVRGSDPPASASLERPPPRVLLTFTEAPDPTLSSIQVLDPGGRAVGAGRAAAVPGRPLQLQAPVGKLGDGTYTVSWRTVSRVDGHVTRGAFAFSVGVGVAAPAAQPAAVPATSAPSALGLTGRWALYWGLALLLGAATTGLLVLGGRLPAAAGPLLGAGLVLAAGGLAAEALAERSAVGVPLGALLTSGPGRALVREAAALLLAIAAVRVLLARRRSRAALVLVGLAAIVAMGAHAAGGTPPDSRACGPPTCWCNGRTWSRSAAGSVAWCGCWPACAAATGPTRSPRSCGFPAWRRWPSPSSPSPG